MGLAEIQYPYTWYNIDTDLDLLVMDDTFVSLMRAHGIQYTPADYGLAHLTAAAAGYPIPTYIGISKGEHYRPTGVVASLKESLFAATETRVRFKYDSRTWKIGMIIDENTHVLLSKTMAEVLGFSELCHHHAGEVLGDGVMDYRRGAYGLYVYCSAIQPQVVGDTMAPLLRIVTPPASTFKGTMVNETYQRIFYYPIATKMFSSIEIDIRNHTGEPIAFERGKVTITLHFRKTRKVLF